jgi:hypothetical protein
MKIITTILLIILIAGLLLISTAAGRSLMGAQEEIEQPVIEENPEVEEEPRTEEPEETEPVEEQQPEEEPDPEAIAAIEVYLDGPRDEGIFLGEAKFGLTSKEAYSIYGERLSQSGFLLVQESTDREFEPGSVHHLYIYTLIPKYGWEYSRQRVVIEGDPGFSSTIELHVDSLGHDVIIPEAEKESIQVSGWSADLSVGDSTGIDKIEIYINGPRDFGTFLGQADYGLERKDVANAYANANYTNSGYRLIFNGSNLEPGMENSIYVYSYSSKGTYTLVIRDILIEGEKDASNVIMSLEAQLEGSSVI